MVAGPRNDVVRKGEPGIYHVWPRTVRQAFLCGYDRLTGTDYSERRTWIRAFEEVIAGIFAIEIAFAVKCRTTCTRSSRPSRRS